MAARFGREAPAVVRRVLAARRRKIAAFVATARAVIRAHGQAIPVALTITGFFLAGFLASRKSR